jgi:hypothetical protein
MSQNLVNETSKSELVDISPLEQYHLVRSQIEHEDNLISQRLSWLLASQSFLFTAYAITLNGPSQSHFKTFEANSELLVRLLPLVGLISTLLIWISILAGISAMKKLRVDFERGVRGHLPGGLPTIQTGGMAFRAGQFGPVLTPLLFVAVWVVLVMHG